ncbi:MAG: cytochrome b N-terminal domain-containing protein [Vicinamibacterales bacterium]
MSSACCSCGRRRRRARPTWVTGVFLLFLLLGFGFSGYLLPWNELAFFATKVGTGIPGSIPIVGEALQRFLRGGDDVTGATLSRFFGLHVVMLLALLIVLGVHCCCSRA